MKLTPNKTVTVHVRMTADEYEALRELARLLDCSLSSTLRFLVQFADSSKRGIVYYENKKND